MGATFMKLGRALWNKVLGHIEAVAILYSTGRAPTMWRILSRGAEVPGCWGARVLGNCEAMSNYLLANSFTT